MKITGIKPCQALSPFISRFWLWEDECALPIMLPGTGNELMIQYRGSPVSVQSESSQKTLLLSHSMLLQPRYQRFLLSSDGKVSFISIRFRHGALRNFTKIPVIELVDQPINIDEIWKTAGQTLELQIINAKTIPQKIRILEQFLLHQLDLNLSTQHAWFARAIHSLYYQVSPDLSDIIQYSNVSHRYFQKVFKVSTGVSPKHFQCIARFEKTLRYLLTHRNKHYLHRALEQGYYDQAHFIKTFKRFTRHTPSDYLNDRNFTTHFYNQSL